MRAKKRIIGAALVIITVCVSASVLAVAPEHQSDATELNLEISADGRAIVDQSGKTIAQFAKGTRIQSTKSGKRIKLPGCMRCKKECVIYEGERCVQWVRSCEWDFDCK